MFLQRVLASGLVFSVAPLTISQGMQADMDTGHAADMAKIHALLGDSSKVKRTTKNTKNGIVSVTESTDSYVAKLIKEHVAAMQMRLKDGRPIREWDPLFAAVFEHHDKVKLIIANTKNGVVVTETSQDAQVVALIQAHAIAVNGFVKDGMAGMHKMHAVPNQSVSNLSKFVGKGDGIKTCPVTGEPIVESVSAVIDGRTIYFCCPGCIGTVKKNPGAYLKPLAKK